MTDLAFNLNKARLAGVCSRDRAAKVLQQLDFCSILDPVSNVSYRKNRVSDRVRKKRVEPIFQRVLELDLYL